ncbi:DUF551 domain-containing protein [Proteus vulgaris]|uniref:DUF551 domain-containing protein n=1 Tax=Proteus vulgaris TaxID=585 RepID=UPI0021A723B7|nr:DUF551 domain-containing protein [Proteus vulgaris]
MQGTTWVKCSDKLPEVGQRVLIATDYPSVYEAVRYFGNKFNRFGQEVTATHWQPLPLPPIPEGE